MPITGRFVADFQDFYTATQTAVLKLKDLESGADKIGPSLNRMVASFSGTKLIQDAILAGEAIERIGGVSRLTEAELGRVAQTTDLAITKLRAMGKDVPPGLQRIAEDTRRTQQAFRDMDASIIRVPAGFEKMTGAAGSTSNAFGTFRTGLMQADRALASFGVNLTPQVAALAEVSAAAGKTAAQLGLVATAGLTAAAALGGWQLGRLISGFFDLDKKIGDATAKLMGWGDVAAQTAGAKADVLARASDIAGREITDLTEAMRINTEAADRFTKETAKAAEAETALAAEAKKARGELLAFAANYLKESNEAHKAAVQKSKALAAEIQGFNETQFRQIAALDATFAPIPGRLDPILQKENELGVAVDDVTRRVAQQMSEWESANATFLRETGGGLVEIGKQADAAQPKVAGLRREAEQLFQLMVPLGTQFEDLYRKAGLFVSESAALVGQGAIRGMGVRGSTGGQSIVNNISVNANNSFFDTASGVQQMADRVGNTLLARMRTSGASIG